MPSPKIPVRLAWQISLFGLIGALFGFASIWIPLQFPPLIDEYLFSRPLCWVPGTVYAILWLIVAHASAITLPRRNSLIRSPKWNLVFLVGITLSYTVAYAVAYQFYQFVADHYPESEILFVVTGFLGGLSGGLALACVWSLFFPAFDSWKNRTITTIVSASLGMLLWLWPALWKAKNEDDWGLLLFFPIWQGGMALLFLWACLTHPEVDEIDTDRTLEPAS